MSYIQQTKGNEKREMEVIETTIKQVRARQVLDSRANPTVEVDICLEGGVIGRAIVPSGASTGQFEALELRDNNPSQFNGKSVRQAVNNVNEIIAGRVKGLDAMDQAGLDQVLIELDGTPNKSKLGANALLGVSMAAAWAAARALDLPLYQYLGGIQARTLPVPMIQMIGGGAHAGGSIDIQDYLIIPVGAHTYSEALEMSVNVYNGTKKVFAERGKPLSIADEGGVWPDFQSNEEGLELLVQGIEQAGYVPGEDICMALDIAASEFYQDGIYHFALEDKNMNGKEMIEVLHAWVDKYPVISIEDGMDENDWDGWQLLTKRLHPKIQLIGDDLFTTNVQRIAKGIENQIANAVLIKMNQIGTLTETLAAIEMTKKAGYRPVISARSGETEDVTIVHLAVATNAGQLKVGSVARSERTAKWNELLRIEETLGQSAIYPGKDVFKSLGLDGQKA